MIYGLKIAKRKDGKWRVSCRDIPECNFEEKSRADAVLTAQSALPGAMVLYYRQKRKMIPLPSAPQKGEILARIPVKVQAKMLFWNYMIENGLKISDVARQLQMSHTEASRLVDLTKDSASIDTVESAAESLGFFFSLNVHH